MKILRKNKYSILAKILKYSFVFLIAVTLLFPMVAVNAQPGTGSGSPGTGTGGPGTTTGTQIQTRILNPLGPKMETIPQFIEAILNFVLIIGVPIVTLAIIYTGFLFVTAQGKPDKLKTAKETLKYVLIGAALLLGSLVIASAIKGTVDCITSASTTC